MPPKAAVSREAILEKAFDMARRDGFERLTARSLARELHCSTQPIFHAFRDMKELERETARYSLRYMLAYMGERREIEATGELSLVLGYIRFALEERHLFGLIARNGLFAAAEAPCGLEALDPKLVVFANGIVFMSLYGTLHMDWTQTRALVSAAYADFARARIDKSRLSGNGGEV